MAGRGRKENPVDPNTVGGRLRIARNQRGLRITDVAELSGFTKPAISNAELGKFPASRRLVTRIAAVLGVNPDEIIGDEPLPGDQVFPEGIAHGPIGKAIDLMIERAGVGDSEREEIGSAILAAAAEIIASYKDFSESQEE